MAANMISCSHWGLQPYERTDWNNTQFNQDGTVEMLDLAKPMVFERIIIERVGSVTRPEHIQPVGSSPVMDALGIKPKRY